MFCFQKFCGDLRYFNIGSVFGYMIALGSYASSFVVPVGPKLGGAGWTLSGKILWACLGPHRVCLALGMEVGEWWAERAGLLEMRTVTGVVVSLYPAYSVLRCLQSVRDLNDLSSYLSCSFWFLTFTWIKPSKISLYSQHLVTGGSMSWGSELHIKTLNSSY